jgi:TonB-dependent receptor
MSDNDIKKRLQGVTNMQQKVFNKNPMATAVTVAMGMAISSMAIQAQEQQPVLEEVVVTGIKASLKRAMDTKRDSAGVVDAITAEDIGAFPDTNLAESLQRITGVAIDRSRGEGSTVTVRGFGADFNLVTLNGRQMPTHSGGGRSFDFGDLASESVSGVEIYKTGQASVATGGIGATINIKTAKPLDNPGLKVAFSSKAVHDLSTAEGREYTPEISGLVSQTFFDDTVGVALSGSFQERDHGQAQVFNTRWFENRAVQDNGQSINPPGAGDLVALPQQFVYQLDEWQRTRVNGQLTLQWRPVESVTATLDYTLAELELDNRYNNMSIWFSPNGQSGTFTDGPIVSPLVYTETFNEPDRPMAAGGGASINERESTGFNLVWDATDRLSLELDYHKSTADRSPNDKRLGTSAGVTFVAYGRELASVDLSKPIAIPTIVMSDPLSPDDMRITGSTFSNDYAEMEIEQAQFSGSFEFSEASSIDFGVALTDVSNYKAGSLVQRNTWSAAQASAYGAIADILIPASLNGVYDQIAGGNQITSNFFVIDINDLIDRAEFLQSLPVGNPYRLANADESDAYLNLLRGDCGTGFCADSNVGFGDRFLEETKSAYLQFNHAGVMFDRDYRLRAGVRYEETDVTSTSLSVVPDRIVWASRNEFTLISEGGLLPTGLEGNYDAVLPSIDFDINLTDEMVLRASYSETIARSAYDNLVGTLQLPAISRVNKGVTDDDATVGNPGLLPHESENWDLSFEYYYGDSSYVSAGYFKKSVENFVTDAELKNQVLFPGLAHPAFGPVYQDAVDALISENAASPDPVVDFYPDLDAVRAWIFDNTPNAAGVDGTSITGVTGRDGDAVFNVNTKINSAELAEIDGWEIAWQHDFADTGFGFIANATFADGTAVFNRLSDKPQFALPGLSDTRNFIAYYDKYGIQVRVAYNWRDEFFTGGVTQPAYREEYEQWDANASYEVTDSLTVFVEGINLTNETFRSFGRSSYQLYNVGQSGARYQFGFRYVY